jgi:ABC-type branched-subunit amino acid transport system substrate-binding protein
MRRALLAAVLLAAALPLAGCGERAGIERGGTIIGETLTVYSLLPAPEHGAARDVVDGEKLALAQAGGKAGRFKVNFASLDEGGAEPAERAADAAGAARDAIADPQVVAVIEGLDSGRAMTAVPLFNAAGILQVSPDAGYHGLTSPAAPGEPARFQPAGGSTFARVVGDDRDEAAALVAAAVAEAGPRPAIAVEQEPGPEAEDLAAAVRGLVREAGGRLVGDSARADAVVYAGDDVANAAGVAEGVAREAPGAVVVLGDALVGAGVAERLAPAARRRAILVSRAPRPGSTPALRTFEASFRRMFGRAPGPCAAVGYEAMRTVLEAVERAGPEATRRQAVIDAYFRAPERDGLLGRWRTEPSGRRTNPAFSAVRARDGAPVRSRAPVLALSGGD